MSCGTGYTLDQATQQCIGLSSRLSCIFLPVKAREYVLPALVCVSVCMSVTTITKKIVDGFVPNFMGRFLLRVSLRSVEGCGSINSHILQMAHYI